MLKLFDYPQIKPHGWLKDQLIIQANGLSGNLDKVWPDVRDSAWIGGDRDGWERVPYWLDGFIPLAYLLEDADMIARAKRYMDAIMDRQGEDGWLCPNGDTPRSEYDLWAVFLLGKVLALYYSFTKEERVEQVLRKMMKNLHGMLKNGEATLFNWGKFRWFEALIPLCFLQEKQPEDWIVETGHLLREQGANYPEFTKKWERPLNYWMYETHIVNLGMMFKYEALCCRLFGEKYTGEADRLWRILERYNGTAVGTFTGDECLSGVANNQGTELCSVVELMYSCEQLYLSTGKTVWLDRLERAAFNALPATISDDMWTHQYDQQVNQIECRAFLGKSFFRTNRSDAHLFGLEPSFGCCTANFNQGWPKLAMFTFLQEKNTIVATSLLPAKLETTMNGAAVTVTAESEYPFRHTCRYAVETSAPTKFALKIRIPSWAKDVRVNGESIGKKAYVLLNREWNGTEVIEIALDAKPVMKNRPFGLKTVEYGALVYALNLNPTYKMFEYERARVERKFPYCDYELSPQREWNRGFASDVFEVIEKPGDAIPFSSKAPRIMLKTKLAPVKWELADGYDSVADKTPVSNRAIGETEDVELIPYGCAKLRMTEMPKVK